MKNKDVEVRNALSKLRLKIDAADRLLFKALAARFKAVEKIGVIKRAQGIPVVQAARWRELRRDRMKLARELGLQKSFVGDLLELIHRDSIKAQQRRKKAGK